MTDILEVELKISEIHHFPDMDPKECVPNFMFETRKLFKIPENTPVPPPELMQLEIKLELMQKQTAMTVAQSLHILNLTMNNETLI